MTGKWLSSAASQGVGSLTLGVKDQEADGGRGAGAPDALNMTGQCK